MPAFLRSRWLHTGLWLGVIFAVSAIPDLKPPGAGIGGIDKLFHAGEYAVLGVLWGRARRGGRWPLLQGAFLGLVVGGLDELSQGRVHGRQMDLLDAAADLVGAACGCFAWSLWTRRRRDPILS